MNRPLVVGLLLVVVTSCAEPRALSPERAPSPLPPAEAPGAPGVPWAEKTAPQRMEFMGLQFFPEMRKRFRAHDAARYEKFRCQSCHGEDMVAAKFRMPNGLYALPRTDPIAAAMNYDAETTAFMRDAVVPLAESLLGTDPRAPSPCHTCHPVAD